MTEIHFYMGKGGVGKSTLAVLHAFYLARQGRSVKLISLDPAHNLRDILRDQSVPGLKIDEINLNRWLRKYLKRIEDSVNRSYRYFTAFNLEKNLRILKYAPAMEEYAMLIAFQEILNRSGAQSHLIVDMPPTALALRFFNLPRLSLIWIDHLIQLRSDIKRRREMITKIKMGSKEFEQDKVLNELIRQKQNYEQTLAILKNMQNSAIHVVCNPDQLSIKETETIIHALKEQKLSIRRILINKADKSDLSIAALNKFNDFNKVLLPLSDYELTGKKNLDKYLNSQYNSVIS